MKAGTSVGLVQQVKRELVSTAALPLTSFVLAKTIPTIFENDCFNNSGLTFREEVKDTEIGHLFEHLILENLKLESLKENIYSDFRGETYWDWKKECFGRFNIDIEVNKVGKRYFYRALLRSITILESIYKINFNNTISGGAVSSHTP